MGRFNFHYGWIVVFTGMLVTIGAHGFGRMSYTLILPEMRQGLDLTHTQAGLIATGNFIGYMAFALIGGFLAAKYGSRLVISLSLLLMGITLILTGVAETFGMAFLMRLLTGLGNGGAYVPALALGSTWFVVQKRGFATGIVSGGIGIGTLLASFMVPSILVAYGDIGWRYAWFWLGALVIIISIIAYIFLRSRPEDIGLKLVGEEFSSSDSRNKREDNTGSGKENKEGNLGPKPSSPAALQWGLVYRVKEVWFLGIVYFMYGFSYVIYMTFFVDFLSETGLTVPEASAMWARVGALSIFCGVIWGRISDVLGRNYGAALAYLTLGSSYLIFALFDAIPAFYISAVLFGISAWSIPTIMVATSGDYVGPRLAPAAAGFITVFFGIGQLLGPAVGGYVRDVTGVYTFAFLLAAAVSGVGLVGSLFLRRPPTSLEQNSGFSR